MIVKNQDSLHDCELCNDTGFTLYEKKHHDTEFSYTTATYCICEKGQKIATGNQSYFREKMEKIRKNQIRPEREKQEDYPNFWDKEN